MSTERKPGSRGSRGPDSPQLGKDGSRLNVVPKAKTLSEDEPKKGSTKTQSPKRGFKKRKK